MPENWKPILGYEGLYEVSDLGNVRRLVTLAPIQGAKAGAGYLKVNLWKSGKQHQAYIHILVMEHFGPPQPRGHEVDHANGNKLDNRLTNLQWISHAENCSRAYNVNGVRYSGIARLSKKLTSSQVIEIRRLHTTAGIRIRDLAKKYGVTSSNITQIVYFKTWKHI